ncbi:MAG: hypothetical protein WCF84_02685 [Anaerolineae bacterium]
MSGSISYVFYAIDKPLSRAERAAVASLSRRASPTARRVDFWYQVDGYDLPVAYESLLAQYYDIVVRQEYEQWTLGIAWPYDAALHEALKIFECDDGEGCGVRVIPIDTTYPKVKRKTSKATRLLAEITAFLDYDVLDSLKGLRELPWDRIPQDDKEIDEAEDWEDEQGDDDGPADSPEETLAQLANCIREDVAGGDLRAFYLAWKSLHDSDVETEPDPPAIKKRLPPYLKSLGQLLTTSADR